MCCPCTEHDSNPGKLQLRLHRLRYVQMQRKCRHYWDTTHCSLSHLNDGNNAREHLRLWKTKWGSVLSVLVSCMIVAIFMWDCFITNEAVVKESWQLIWAPYQLRREWFRPAVPVCWTASCSLRVLFRHVRKKFETRLLASSCLSPWNKQLGLYWNS